MTKRRGEESISDTPCPKRTKLSASDRLSSLSDELLLRILSYVPFYDLTVCQRVSQRFHTIAGDSQLWKAAYYHRFVRPRALWLPKSKSSDPASTVYPPSKASKWLVDDATVKRGVGTNWKRQFKLRHKWSNGTCKIKDIPIPAPPVLPVLARLHDGVVYTVDSSEGFRAWSYKDDRNLLASKALDSSAPLPASLAVDLSSNSSSKQLLATSFVDGCLAITSYNKHERAFETVYWQPRFSNGRIYSMAFSWPYILTISATQTLSLYKCTEASVNFESPRLLTSLKSQIAWSPLSLSLRIRDSHIIAAVAYCTPTYISGWSTGVQELHVTPEGEILDSRLATAHTRGFNPLSTSHITASPSAPPMYNPPTSHGPSRADQTSSKPTSLSYSHPYLLVGHSDNTLTLYMVTSTAKDVSISAGKTLWGHTSSVFDAHVGSRGKAVSVSSRGNEVRIWELERSNFLPIGNCRAEAGSGGAGGAWGGNSSLSVQISPERKSAPASSSSLREGISDAAAAVSAMAEQGITEALALGRSEALEVTRAWVGFDEENVVVLREQSHGRQALDIYDFS